MNVCSYHINVPFILGCYNKCQVLTLQIAYLRQVR